MGKDPFGMIPEYRLLAERQAAIAQQGPLAAVLVDRPLPEGIRTVIHLGEPVEPRRYFVASMTNFDDEVLDLAQGLAMRYELDHGPTEARVVLTLYRDGRFESSTGVAGTFQQQRFASPSHVPNAASRYILDLAADAPFTDVQGVGRAKVVVRRP